MKPGHRRRQLERGKPVMRRTNSSTPLSRNAEAQARSHTRIGRWACDTCCAGRQVADPAQTPDRLRETPSHSRHRVPFQPHLSANLQVTFYAVAVVSVLPLAVPFAAAASVPSLAAHTAKKETAEHSRSAINLYGGTVDNIAQSLLRFYRLNPIPEG